MFAASNVRIALEDMGLSRVFVLYPGKKRFPLTDEVEAVPLHSIAVGTSVLG